MTGIIDNINLKLEDVLKEELNKPSLKQLSVAVGYFYTSGLKTIFPELKKFIHNGGEITVLMGNNVNRRTQEDLVEIFKDLDLAKTKQLNHLIQQDERDELFTEAKNDLDKQILYTTPTPETEDFLNLIGDWVESGKFKLRIYPKERFHAKAYIFKSKEGISITQPKIVGIVGSSNFTLTGFRSNTELNAVIYTADAEALESWYQDRWEESEEFSSELLKVLNNSWVSYKPGNFPSPYLVYLKAVYELYKESLQTAEQVLRTFEIYQDLYDFQKWAVLRAIKIANNYNGVMVSDVVGMGKTYIGAAILEHYYHTNVSRGRRGKVLIICPPKLHNIWETVKTKYSLHADILSLGKLSQPDCYPELMNVHQDTVAVLIDESHHFRNTGTNRYNNLSRYLPIVNQVVLLTATPYARGPEDVYNQIKLFHWEDLTKIPITPPNLRDFLKKVQRKEAGLSELLSHIMVRRTRYDILDQYGEKDIEGKTYLNIGGAKTYLPRRQLKTKSYSIEDVYGEGLYSNIVEVIKELTYARYSLGSKRYLKPSHRKVRKYSDLSSIGKNLRGLMKTLLLKRLESSIYSFKETLRKMVNSYSNFFDLLNEGKVAIGDDIDELLREESDLEIIRDMLETKRTEGKIEEYELSAFYLDKLKQDLGFDIKHLKDLYERILVICEDIRSNFSKDDKLKETCELLNALFSGKSKDTEGKAQKIILFSQYADTVDHLSTGLAWMQKKGYLLKSVRMETVTSKTRKVDDIVERFAPIANLARAKVSKDQEIDLLVSTDLMGEGLNLQDANIVVNYDIHWNPLKLIQRIGRVDRLGTEYDIVYVFNFLPETTLEKELGVVEKVEGRIKEINEVLGTDAKILKEDEQPNPHYMISIYEEEIEEIEDFEREVLLGKDAVSESVSELRRLLTKEPELMEKIIRMDGLRSAKYWEGEKDAIFLVCKAGDYATPYLVDFVDDKPQITTSAQETLIQLIKCDVDEKPAKVNEERFRERYSRACKCAQKLFEEEIKQRERLVKPRSSAARSYVEKELRKLSRQIEDPELTKTVNHYRDIVHDINIYQVLEEFKDLQENNVTGDNIFRAVEEIVMKYNLEDKFERKKVWREELREPPHIVCGLYLKSGVTS